ncbi:MAG TPA: bifunctional nicotinamidase/pyrazinamidase [Candidatus Hydrothermia bacterium]|nr:bifunctional nicotinamidase/pyrazinamidase [Candidatus Hydrothermae bacterium]MDD3649053.1 bifunctional nicotinamidase/pyrazinamidase [Candidatus Hydrothermia bacterium]MDD5573002.1 bifunctional nicotinamidase/pyrazinamidase [Candidatus Hydrothermia bacterium]HOP32164.1 bifunctional nicotinamidase/pyrazinamidase [Candidatus Hydrothermia bacterium]
MKIRIRNKDTLVIVDVQKDFCPGGALEVPQGDEIIPILNKYIEIFASHAAPIVVTRDWHPENHSSFKDYGGVWPRHCVRDTEGAAFHAGLNLPKDTIVVSKATEPEKDAYSGFDGTNLEKALKGQGITRIFVGGLATDYCVKATVLDALRLGFCTFVLLDAIKGVNIVADDSERAIIDMLEKGAIGITFQDL